MRLTDPAGLECWWTSSDHDDTPEGECVSSGGSYSVNADGTGGITGENQTVNVGSNNNSFSPVSISQGGAGSVQSSSVADYSGGAPSSVMKTLTCASELANNYSIAGVLGLTSESFKSAHPTIASIGTGFLGNTFSGITDFGTHLYNTGTQGGGSGAIATDLAVGGVGQGLPVGESALFKGAAGLAQDALVNVGEKGLADAFGFAKIGIDLAIYGASAIHCYNHP
jgi:hypothetical protein